MNTIVWDQDFIYNGPQSVKVSCHAGDHGVSSACNMVGDQPLFYLDDAAEEEMSALDDFLIEDMGLSHRDEDMLFKMRSKIKAYEKSAKLLSDIHIQSPEYQFDEFLRSTNTQLNLADFLNFGMKSNTFKSYYEFLNTQSIAIILDDNIQTSFYDRKSGQIILNKNLDQSKALIACMKAMRTAWTHKQGVLINPLAFQPEEAIIINRIQAADRDVAVIAMLWDMKLAGESDLWNTAMTGSDYDLCSAYAMEAMTDFRAIKSGLAARATFEKWFISGRCKLYDSQIIQTMLGKHSDIEIGQSDASRIIALDLIGSLGRRPEGENYLASIALQIMNDGIYGDVRDRSNANFLWFVTFERRMAEMEQQLQGDEKDDQTQEKENVISLPQSKNKVASIKGDHNASLYFLDHFRAG